MQNMISHISLLSKDVILNLGQMTIWYLEVACDILLYVLISVNLSE